MSDNKKVEPLVPSLEVNGQWSLKKTKQEGRGTRGLARGDWFHSGNDRHRKHVERMMMDEAEEKRKEKERLAEEDRIKSLTNPFTGQIDSFAPGGLEAHRQRIQQLSEQGVSTKQPVVADMAPQLQYQRRAQAHEQASHQIKQQQDAHHEQHMADILAGRKQPVTVWEKAALVAHMKQQAQAPSKTTSASAKPSNIVVRRKQDLNKADSEMAFGDITELLHHIKELRSLLKPDDKLPDWVKAKLTLAADYLSTVAHYVDGKKESGSPLEKSDEKLKLLKGELLQLKDYMKHRVSDPVKAQKLIADAKAMGDKKFKDNMKSIASEKPDVKKADNTLDYSKMKSLTSSQIQRQNEANMAAQRAKIGVGQGSGKDLQVGSAPRLSGIAGKYEMGKTRSGKPVMSHPDHPSHSTFSAQDHNDAMSFHRQKRDELRSDPGVNKDLVTHHQNAAEHHSKMAAQLRAAGSGMR